MGEGFSTPNKSTPTTANDPYKIIKIILTCTFSCVALKTRVI